MQVDQQGSGKILEVTGQIFGSKGRGLALLDG